MATYAIGDVHGCRETLKALLAELPPPSSEDRLWLVGDLVNRGPDSLGVLRWAAESSERLGGRFAAVLGNHDVHLLARAAGVAGPKRRDTLERLLEAPDRDELLAWLGRRPLLHREGDTFLVHAGLLPAWSVEEAEARARKAEEALRGPEAHALLARYGARGSKRPRERATAASEAPPDEAERLEAPAGPDQALAVLTSLRTVDVGGAPCFGFTGPLADAPPGLVPWFEAPGRRSAGATVVFGHWAALGLRFAPGVRALDSGCVWGGALTALRLEDGRVWQVACRDRPR
ncbi:MAG TPA: symmetrical bis(5'-nucleosyl)-tetraphosphatase [Thermoanaerobaculia bacterium]|nr:symmetrical bis(5'-nucleosyl)-tetraphosphatase [Thermoanaerobaculia bacterium]